MPYVYSVTFGAIQNSSKLRILFSYGLPCMYTGIEMIDPKLLSRWLKNRMFSRPASQVLEILDKFENTFAVGVEAEVLGIIKDRARIHPDKNIKELLKEVEPIYKRQLRKQQAPIFYKLTEAAYDLPVEYQKKFQFLMRETNKKLDEKPVIIPFSSYEFKYKLAKIYEDVLKNPDRKSKKVMNKLMKEAKRFSNSTTPNTIENQKKVFEILEIIWKKSKMKHDPQLKELFETSKARLYNQEFIAPFSRKTFIYDLARMLDDLPDTALKDKLISIAQELPTSQENVAAFILKVSTEPVEKIGHRLIWPYLASVEHIHPKSEGGLDCMANFGGATTRANSTRKSIPFVEQLKLVPETAIYCQKYLDRLIELYDQGVFTEHNINPKYITDFADTIYKESKQTLKLDTSKFKYKDSNINTIAS